MYYEQLSSETIFEVLLIILLDIQRMWLVLCNRAFLYSIVEINRSLCNVNLQLIRSLITANYVIFSLSKSCRYELSVILNDEKITSTLA